MNGSEMLEKCGEFPVFCSTLGMSVGNATALRQLFMVPAYEVRPVADRRIARRMVSLCAFEGSRAA
jgi:hypothetical protein